MIDEEGYRPNVGIILCNQAGQVLWAKRIGQDAWQFPQGGLLPGESVTQALYRELNEEVGLQESQVTLVANIRHWIYYRLPKQYIRHHSYPLCIGQKQKWFLLQLRDDAIEIKLNQDKKPEFDDWKWVNCWEPLRSVVTFKQHVYREVLKDFEPKLQAMKENSA